jgi:hypothetical protein
MKKSTLYLYSKCTFFAAKSKGAILCACVICTLCVSDHLLGAKLGTPDEFPPNCFPITPPRNGNIGNGYRDLLEAGFKVGENSAMPKKIARQNFLQKIKTTFLEHDFFPLLKLKKWVFVPECAAELPFLSPVKIIFQKFSLFLKILSPIWLCAILCAPTVFS